MIIHEYLAKAVQDDLRRAGERGRLLREARRARRARRQRLVPAAPAMQCTRRSGLSRTLAAPRLRRDPPRAAGHAAGDRQHSVPRRRLLARWPSPIRKD